LGNQFNGLAVQGAKKRENVRKSWKKLEKIT
jgi:hypothetical protein